MTGEDHIFFYTYFSSLEVRFRTLVNIVEHSKTWNFFRGKFFLDD